VGGGWLVGSSFAIEPVAGAAVRWNGIVAGAVVVVMATIRLATGRLAAGMGMANIAAGGWLIMSPLTFGYPLWVGSRLAWSDLATGIMITAVGLASVATGADDC
jgi:hypothetical protein